MKLWSGLLMAAMVLFASAFAVESEELIVVSIVAGAASLTAYIADLKARIRQTTGDQSAEKRLEAIEQRLALTEGELELTRLELGRLRDAQEFDLQLSDPAAIRNLPRRTV